MGKKLLDVIEDVVDLRTFLLSFDIEVMEYHDGTFRGCCPVHGGNNPSAFVAYKNSKGRYSWACYTNDCHVEYGGNMIGLIAGFKKCTVKKAIYMIAKKFKIEKDSKGDVTNVGYSKKIGSSIITPEKPIEHEVIEKSFLSNSHSRRFGTDFFSKKNIPDKIVNKFGLGYNILSNRITIPIWDENNRLVGWDSRYINDKYIDTVDVDGFMITKYKISAGLKKRNLLYGLNQYRKTEKLDYVVLVEGFKDVWLLYSIGVIGVSVFGHSLSAYQLYLLKQRTKNVIVCFDNDADSEKNPGQKGAKRVHKILTKNGLNVKNICPPSNLDIGDAFLNKDMYSWVQKNIVTFKNQLVGAKNE